MKTTEEKIKNLAEYDGEDRIISSHEMVLKLNDKPESVINVKSFIPSLDNAIEGFREGELIVISGPTKQGKTLLSQSLTAAFVKQQYYPLWFSYEVPVRQFLNQFRELPLIYLPEKLKAHVLPWFEERVHESFEKYHTRIIFCDHLHYLIDLARIRNPSIEIGQIIRNLKSLAVSGEFIIFLLCHTTKGASEDNLSFESIRDCLPGDALVYSGGIRKKVKSLLPGDPVVSKKSVRALQGDMIKSVWPVGKKKMLEITTKTGRKIVCSDGHKLFAATFHKAGKFGPGQGAGLQGWTEAKNLNVGQKVAVPQRYPVSNLQASITAEQAFILGLVVGDGHVTPKGHTEITANTQGEVDLISAQALKAWNMKVKVTPYQDKKAYRIYLSNERKKNKYLEFIRAIKYCATGTSKHVPEIIFAQPNEIVAKFLSGLFQADGNASYSGNEKKSLIVRLDTISEGLARDVLHLLLRFSIVSHLRQLKTGASGFRTDNRYSFSVNIRSLDAELFNFYIGFVLEKQRSFEEKLKMWVPRKFKKHRGRDILFDRIKSIRSVGERECYDVSIVGHHRSLENNSFCVDDFITHNSSFISQESDSVFMIKRTPEKGETAARLRVEFHRRTGVLEKIIQLIKVNGYLVEHEEAHEGNRYGND